jgi:peptidoglycan/xylan/chitin deacetylase (PgdA/CDA1 family)
MSMRSALRRLRAEALRWTGQSRRAQRRLDGSCATVLLYHRVLPRANAERYAVEPGMYVTPETFARHLDWLTADFRVLPLPEIAARLARGESLPRGACAITFDDGWRDNADYALPELSRRGIPAAIFVVTERVGTQGAFWPDEVCRCLAPLPASRQRELAHRLGAAPGEDPISDLLDALKRVPEAERGALIDVLRAETSPAQCLERELCNWEELAQLAAAGVVVESHGATHAILTGLADAEVERELRRSRDALHERGHGRHDLLVYPSGAYDSRIERIASEAGYRAAFTTEPGLWEKGSDPMALPRVGVHEDVSGSRSEFLFRVPGFA